MSDIDRLRADLACLESAVNALERHSARSDLITIKISSIRDKIARLEADAAPWREAKKDLAYIVKALDWKSVGYYVDHLTAENDRLAKRVAELEAEIKAEDGADIADAEKALAEMVRANQDMGLYEANADTSERKPRRPHDRITMQRRIKMQRRELRRLNGMMRKYSHTIMMKDHDIKIVRDALKAAKGGDDVG